MNPASFKASKAEGFTGDGITGVKSKWSVLELNTSFGKKRELEIDFPMLLELSQLGPYCKDN
jgi:hypothetical protein